jgi:5'-nucleotidase
LWTLVKELKNFAQVVVVAPDREQSGTGTAVTLRQPLKIQRVKPLVPKVEAYSVGGTPADSVILALGKLIKSKIDLVVSGINPGPNLGEDALISGTVGAALQGYLHGFPALAISVAAVDSIYLDNAAKFGALLTKKIEANILPTNILLNVNLPNLPLAEIKGIQITRLARKSHANTVEERLGQAGEYYWIMREKISTNTDRETDIWAIEQGNIAITPLHIDLLNNPSPPIPDSLFSDILQELQNLNSHQHNLR